MDRSEIDAVADRNLAILETMFLKMNRGKPWLGDSETMMAFIPVNINIYMAAFNVLPFLPKLHFPSQWLGSSVENINISFYISENSWISNRAVTMVAYNIHDCRPLCNTRAIGRMLEQ